MTSMKGIRELAVSTAAVLAVTGFIFIRSASANVASVPVNFLAHATTTKAYRTNWNQGYANANGFTGNFAKTQYLTVRLADYAYESEANARAALYELGFILKKYISVPGGILGVTDAQALIAEDFLGRVTVVAVRGTDMDEIRDVLTDLFMHPTLFSGDTSYHRGFYNYATALRSQVLQYLGSYCGGGAPNKSLWITGHSLGGAAASILAHQLEMQGCRVHGVSTFGTPMAGFVDWQNKYKGDGATAQDLQYRSHRWVNNNDIVYCLPIGGKWRHVGIEHYVAGGGGITVANNYDGSICEDFPLWMDNLLTVGAAFAPPGSDLALAIADFHNGIIEFALQCQPGFGWDDLWSLGVCSLIDVDNRLRDAYGMTPEELLEETAATVELARRSESDHYTSEYIEAIGDVDFSLPGNDVPISGPPIVW